MLSLSKNANLIQKNQELLDGLSLAEWIPIIESFNQMESVWDASSLSEYIDKFQSYYDE